MTTVLSILPKTETKFYIRWRKEGHERKNDIRVISDMSLDGILKIQNQFIVYAEYYKMLTFMLIRRGI